MVLFNAALDCTITAGAVVAETRRGETIAEPISPPPIETINVGIPTKLALIGRATGPLDPTLLMVTGTDP